MRTEESKIEDLIKVEIDRMKRKQLSLDGIDFSYQQNKRGMFSSKLKAKTNKKTIFLSDKNRSLETSIKRCFVNLKRILGKEKFKRPRRLTYNLNQAI